MNRIRVLMIGPQPPSIGGISSYIRELKMSLECDYNVNIIPIAPYCSSSYTFKKYYKKLSSAVKNSLRLTILSIKHDFDIAHVHTSSNISFFENSIYIIIIKYIAHRKIILHIHAPDFDVFLNKFIVKLIAMMIINKCDSVIVLSKYWCEIVSKEVNNKNNISIISNAASNEFYPLDKDNCRERLNLPKNKKIILSVGNLTKRKGFHDLIDAIELLHKQNDDILCIIGGSGEMQKFLTQKIGNQNLSNHIRLVGHIAQDELNYWINSSDIVVLPSLAEGVPILIFEALNCAKPVIVTNVGGMPDIITSEEYGFVIEPGNSKKLAKYIQICLYTKSWNKEAILIYANTFSYKNIADKLYKMYTKGVSRS